MKFRLLLSGIALAVTLPAAAASVTATISSTYNPPSVTIVAGDSVTWNNVGGGFHNVVADDASFRCAQGCDGAGGNGDANTANWTFDRFFASAGTVAYHCEVHGGAGGIGMSGTITVLPVTIFNDGFEGGNTSAWSAAVP